MKNLKLMIGLLCIVTTVSFMAWHFTKNADSTLTQESNQPQTSIQEEKPKRPFPNCDYHKNEKIQFGKSVTDTSTLDVSVKGVPCYEGVYTISIKDSGGKEIYKYSEPFKKHVATQWNEPTLNEVAERLVKDTGLPEEWKTSNELPPYPGTDNEDYSVPKGLTSAQYEDYKNQKLPLFYHMTHYESWQWLIFNAAKEEAIVILQGGN